MDWHQISVVSAESSSDLVSETLIALGAVSITFKDATNQPLYEPPPDTHPLWEQTQIVALFENAVDLDAIQQSVSSACPNAILNHWEIELLRDRIWEREWMEHFKPMHFGKGLWICPSHQPPPDPNAINLQLDPGLAFGTGTHPTTALCLEWLANEKLQGLDVMDYGCGSGVLAIASILLGAKRSVAVDIDPQALTATKDNAKQNAVENQIICALAEHSSDEISDILVANILAKPLVNLAPILKNHVKPGGKLVLSGILHEQIDCVQKAYEKEFHFSPPTLRENWARLDATKTL